MNDLEICKRIAEIKKIHVSNAECGMYNPLAKTETGKALCFDLMDEYKIEVEHSNGFCVRIFKSILGDSCCSSAMIGKARNTDLQKAICLAVIEANKDNKK